MLSLTDKLYEQVGRQVLDLLKQGNNLNAAKSVVEKLTERFPENIAYSLALAELYQNLKLNYEAKKKFQLVSLHKISFRKPYVQCEFVLCES